VQRLRADLDQDGEVEVVVGTAFDGPDKGAIYLWDGDGTPIWANPVQTVADGNPYGTNDNYLIHWLDVADPDGDGQRDVLAISRHAADPADRLVAVGADGVLDQSWWHPGPIEVVVVANLLDVDPEPEVLIGAGNAHQAAHANETVPTIGLLPGDDLFGEAPPDQGSAPPGSQLFYRVVEPDEDGIIRRLRLEDVDGDGEAEILGYLSADGSGTEYCLEQDGRMCP